MKISVTYLDGRTVEGDVKLFNTPEELSTYLNSGPTILTIPTVAGGILVDIETIKRVDTRTDDSLEWVTIFNSGGDLVVSEYDLSSVSEEQDIDLEDNMAEAKSKKSETSVVEIPKTDEEMIDIAVEEFVSFRDTFLKYAESQKPFYPGIIKKMIKRGELLKQTDEMLNQHITDLNEVIKSGE